MMEIDRYLSLITRRLPKTKGMPRLVKPLRAYFANKYQFLDCRWVLFDEYDGDIKMRLDRSSYIGGSIYWLGYHHWRELDYLKKNLKPDMVFVDIGANQGEFTLFSAKYLDKGAVLSFEPQKDMFQSLKENIGLNSFDNISCFNYGLGDKERTVDLYTSKDVKPHGGLHEGLFTAYPSGSRDEYIQKISIRRLDDVLSENAVERIDYIKIDVEGGELFVLKGAQGIISA